MRCLGVIHDKLLTSLAFVKSVTFTARYTYVFLFLYMNLFIFGSVLALKVQGVSRCAFKRC